MGHFFFKEFSVKQDRSAMKVNTDGVLLGAWCSLPNGTEKKPVFVTDVGTGTGVIALMVAQRLYGIGIECSIDGIDPDDPSAVEAGENFNLSPWRESLISLPLSFSDYMSSNPLKRDLIVSNPPYFTNSLKAPCSRRSKARHNDSLSFSELANCSERLLSPNGTLSIILPSDGERDFISAATEAGLSLSRICRVSTITGESPRRVMMEFAKEDRGGVNEERLSVQESPSGSFTDRYKALTSAFYLKF